MNDQENIRQINERNKKLEKEEKSEEKSQEQLTKEHYERLAALHRQARGQKW